MMNKRKIKHKEFKKIVQDICNQIEKSDWRPTYVVGITRGGLMPALYISHYFNVKMHTLDVSLRDHEGSETNCWMSEDAFGYNGEIDQPVAKNILIVDDINDTGATLNWIMQDWQSTCLPNDARWNHVWGQNVKFAVLVDNLSSDCKVKMDFCGLEINKAEDDVWIEFPYEAWWK